MELSAQQGDAVRKIGDWFENEPEKPYFEMGGFAGCGKSSILPYIINELNCTPDEIAFCAPTGKAAKVMGNKLKEQGISALPSTIHSLIYKPKMQKASILESQLAQTNTMIIGIKSGEIFPPSGDKAADLAELERKAHIIKRDLDRAYDLNDLHFSLNPDSRLVQQNVKLLIVDEASMVGTQMRDDLLDFEIPILAIGDPGQLKPVGDTPGFFQTVPDAFLTEVHRQAADNPIIRLATLARKGKAIEYGDYGDGVNVVSKRQDTHTLDLERECQVIVGTNKTRWSMTSKMRRAGGYTDSLPHEGEPLIMCKNSREHPTLVNGTQLFAGSDHGRATEGRDRFLAHVFDEDGKGYKMYCYQGLFEEHLAQQRNFASCEKSAAYRSRGKDHQIDFAWAITCHKSQGSQWDEVVVHDESGSFREESANWLYTAITRAAKRLTIVM